MKTYILIAILFLQTKINAQDTTHIIAINAYTDSTGDIYPIIQSDSGYYIIKKEHKVFLKPKTKLRQTK